jgi:mono/diheme cytochrome c family protein/glucose/arabinose dehydrogenase
MLNQSARFTRVAAAAALATSLCLATQPSLFSQAPAPAPAPAPEKKSDRTKNRGPEQVELKFKLPPPAVRTPEEALKTFKVEKGFKVQLVASEPMIETPVAMSWDHKGRLYVVEMRGYMNDVDGKGEDQKIGRIKRLVDVDGDGVMDRATVFVDNLLMPRGVMALGDGAVVAEPPTLKWYHDTDDDGVADKNEEIGGSYGSAGGQPEHMANSPTWCLDNWIWSAGYGTRFKYSKGQFISEPTRSGGQWGLTQDDWGRRYFNYNSDLLRTDLLPPSVYARNPNLADRTALNFRVMSDQKCWPSVPTPGVNRGYNTGQLTPDGKLATVTGTCGPCVYRGDLFGKAYDGNAFIPEPCGNLVKRLVLTDKEGIMNAKNAYTGVEFMTSTDERFRPVNAYNGPDGALYVVDMYRGIVQHKYFLTHYLIANIKARNLEQPVNMGRIWRIVPEKAETKRTVLPEETTGIVALLSHANGHVRDTAQRVLVERGDAAVAREVEKIATTGATPQVRVQALWTLEGLKALTPELLTTMLKDAHPKVRAAAVSMSNLAVMGELLKMTGDSSAEVRVQLAIQLSALPGPDAQKAVLGLLKAGGSPLLVDAIASGVRGRELEYLEALLAEPVGEGEDKLVTSGLLQMLSACVMSERRDARVTKLLEVTATQNTGGPRQLAMLKGTAGFPLDKKLKAQPRKLLYLDAQPAALTAMVEKAKGGDAKKLVILVDKSLAWPGKPGVPPPPVVVPLNAEQQGRFEKGKMIYAGLCAACHQPTGLGLEGLAPPLVDSEWVTGPSDRPIKIILHGMSGPIQVSGRTWTLEMPPLPQFTDEDIAGVLTYIRREWEHTAGPVSPNDVAKIRQQHSGRTKAWTAAEMNKKPEKKK